MAILLGAFQNHEIVPRQAMPADKLNLTYAMARPGLAWSIAIANVLGAWIFFLFAN